MRIPVLVCATERNKRVEILEKSFQRHRGWDLRVLGVGRKWESFRTKMECYCEELRRISPDQIVVCLDAYDAVCARDSSGFEAEFKKFRVPIVAGYEPVAVFTIYNKYVRIGVSPDIKKWKAHHEINANDVYVNSGCIVGHAGEVLGMWEWVLGHQEFTIYDDQIGVGYYMNGFPDKVKLDTESRIVWNDNFLHHSRVAMSDDELRVHGGPARTPYFIHFPGLKMSYHPHADRYRKVSAFVVGDDSLLQEDVVVGTDRWWLVPLIVVVVLVVVLVVAKMILGRKSKGGKKKPR